MQVLQATAGADAQTMQTSCMSEKIEASRCVLCCSRGAGPSKKRPPTSNLVEEAALVVETAKARRFHMSRLNCSDVLHGCKSPHQHSLAGRVISVSRCCFRACGLYTPPGTVVRSKDQPVRFSGFNVEHQLFCANLARPARWNPVGSRACPSQSNLT